MAVSSPIRRSCGPGPEVNLNPLTPLLREGHQHKCHRRHQPEIFFQNTHKQGGITCSHAVTRTNWFFLKMLRSEVEPQVVSHNVLIQGSVVVIRQFLIFINQTFLMVSVALVTMVDWRVHLFSCLGPLLGPLGGPEGALEAPKMPKITISCFDYRNAPKWVEQGPKIGWTLQNTFRGVC